MAWKAGARGAVCGATRRGAVLSLAACLLAAAGPDARAADAPAPRDGVFFPAVYADPSDIAANIAYAEAAEARGEWHKALTAYERILLIDPGNAAAREGLARVRFQLAPDFTTFRLTVGGGYESNPLQRPDSQPTPDSALALFTLRVRDERRIGALRWRSHAWGGGELFPDANEVNQLFVGGDVGPLVPVTSTITMRPSVTGSYRSLDGVTLFGEIGGALEAEGYLDGALQAARLKVVWRDYGSRWVSDGGVVVDLDARLARSGVFSSQDAVFFRPALRYSGVDNQSALFIPADFAPGRYFEIGANLAYAYAFTPWLSATADFGVYQRWFEDPVVVGGEDREDTYLSPGLAVTVSDVLSEAVDVTLGYRFEHNASNYAVREFDNHRITARLGVDF